MTVAVFNPTLFHARYPQFANVSDGKLGAYFLEAGLYLNNTDCSRVQDVNKRLVLLNILVAHISQLNGDLSADGQALPVGRVSQATEGSVSATLDYGQPGNASQAWYDQTPFGAAFWAATAYLRSAVYRPRPTRWR
jgi:hypothetical protein